MGIGEQGLENFGRWPWPRSIHGQFLQFLSLRSPKSIAFDLLFTEASQDAQEDLTFADGLLLHPGAITGASTEDLGHLSEAEVADAIAGSMIGNTPALTNVKGDVGKILGKNFALMPVQALAESSMTGFVNVEPSPVDGVRRRAPLVLRIGKTNEDAHIYPSLILQSLMRNENLGPDDVEVVLGKHVRVNGKGESWEIPIDETGQMLINYRGTTEAESNVFEKNEISYFGLVYFLQTYYEALQQDENALWPETYQIDSDDPESAMPIPPVKGQFAFVGQTAAGLTDFGPTPMGAQTPLVKVHCTAMNNILQGDYLSKAPLMLIIVVWLIIAWVSAIFLRESPVWLEIALPVVLAVGYVALAYGVFDQSSVHLPVVWPVLGFTLVHGTAIVHRLNVESQAKGRIKAMFSTYVAPEVVDQLIESGEEPKLGGEETEITAFFSDIQSFSSFSEQLTPEKLVSLMNEYLSEMSYILKYSGSGTVDKFIGDAIVGIFGAPLHYKDHAYRAVITAIEMQQRQAELREAWKNEGEWPEIVYAMQTRIGLNTGPAVVGNMGARDRMNYTMMGDTVNLAARCESGAKSYGVFNMIAGETKESAQKFGKDDVAYRYLDKIIVKGRTQPVEMYEVVDLKSQISDKTSECLELFAEGMKKYLTQDWIGAESLFGKAETLEPYRPGDPGVGNNASLVLMERCQMMKANPPGDDWDGVFVMKTK
ncbi:MAG: adenylate/guanylate cyclase domain-containing protein [Verrucomicrobiota bacterium]